jgi:protein involved in polysaccharide export with SLBB domain
LQAIAVAGGHTYRAQEDIVEINRQVGDELKIFETSIKSPIQPGDTIIVERRLF